MPGRSAATARGMNFPGKKLLRHWWWIVAFKYPRLRLVLSRVLIRSREIDIQLFGAPLRINTREEIGLWRAAKMAEDNVVIRDEVASLLNLALLLQPGDTFVDVGANVGLYSSALSRFRNIFPQMAYVAIEPHPRTAQRLRSSVGAAVTVLNIGISDHKTKLGFASGVTSGVFKVTAPDTAETEIDCERLDALPLSPTDLVVKIDVEEHESAVLRGATGLFESERVKVIYIDGYSDHAIPEFLRARDFTLFDGRTLVPCGADAPRHSLLGIHRTRLNRLRPALA
jgi:FkbM family methyltransferase